MTERGGAGSITVFFALLLTLVLAVICTAVEAARAAALSYLTAQAQEAALESVFAAYYLPLWERYHLLFMADGPGLIDDAEAGMSRYGDSELFSFRAESVQVLETVTAVDEGGRPFLEEICLDMEQHSTERWIPGSAGLQNQMKRIRNAELDVEYLLDHTQSEEWKTAERQDSPEEGEQQTEGRETEKMELEGSAMAAAFGDFREWKNQKILGLVLEDPGCISEAVCPGESGPSGRVEGAALSWNLAQKMAAVRYMAEHFGCWENQQEGSVLSYELEYVAGGQKTDRENLADTAEKILGIRIGADFLYLLTDQEKMLEAELWAGVIWGLTGMTIPRTLIARVIMGGWAAAEAVHDTRRLFAGETVPLMKSGGDWKISLKEAPALLMGMSSGPGLETGKNGGKEKTEEYADPDREQWNYQSYLYLLLLLEDLQSLLFRAMDVIEWNLRTEDRGFFAENCLSYAELETTFRAGRYRFTKRAAYGYQPS